jgi:hypothetical protein
MPKLNVSGRIIGHSSISYDNVPNVSSLLQQQLIDKQSFVHMLNSLGKYADPLTKNLCVELDILLTFKLTERNELFKILQRLCNLSNDNEKIKITNKLEKTKKELEYWKNYNQLLD